MHTYIQVLSQASAARVIYAEEGLVSSAHYMGLGLMGTDCSEENLENRIANLHRECQGDYVCFLDVCM